MKREPREGKGGEKDKKEEEEGEVYSDPDEGVEIVDMDNVRTMDWMAPESLKRERSAHKKKKVKVEDKGKEKIGTSEVVESIRMMLTRLS